MLSPDVRIGGFDALSWARLLSLVTGNDPDHPDLRHRRRRLGGGDPGTLVYGTLVIVEDAEGRAVAAFQTQRGTVDIRAYAGPSSLATLCAAHAAERAVVIRQDAIELLWQRASEQLDAQGDYAAQWLKLAEISRALVDEGELSLWPPPARRMRIPSARMVERALDLVLPDEHGLLLVLWQGTELWTGVALRRRGGQLDWMVGPDHLLAWTGPLGGDWRRDYRVIADAVAGAVAPLHVGIFAQTTVLQALLRNRDPGAWARAIAVRDLIVHPAPPYVGVAVGADAVRAITSHSSRWLRGIDLAAGLAPLARFARSHVAHIASIRDILGFSPLDQLGTWLRRREGADTSGTAGAPQQGE